MENPTGSAGDFSMQGGLNVVAGTTYYVTTLRPDYTATDSYTYVTGDVYVTPSV
jgi:hypothetical protein